MPERMYTNFFFYPRFVFCWLKYFFGLSPEQSCPRNKFLQHRIACHFLVGHHSEKRHRRDLDRIHNLHGKSIEAGKKADHYRKKAAAVANNQAISSDDPEAVQKLAGKIVELEQLQVFMKEANKCIRKKDLLGFLKLPRATEQLWQKLNTPDFVGMIGFPSYKLTNNSQNVTRLKKQGYQSWFFNEIA